MRASNVTPAPGILLTDNAEIAAKFDTLLSETGTVDSFVSEINALRKPIDPYYPAYTGIDPLTMSISDVDNFYANDYYAYKKSKIAIDKPNEFEDVLFLTNNDNHFISLEYQYMANSSPRLTIELLETSEYFESRLFRSTIRNLVNNVKSSTEARVITPPTTQFYIAFGSSDDLSYWSSFQSFYLVDAESYGEFGGAKTIKLGFSPTLSINNINFEALKPFINKSELFNLGILSRERVTISTKRPFNYEAGLKRIKESPDNSESIYFLNRKEYRSKNLIYFLETIENIIDETLQTIFNTPNVLLLCPIDYKNFPLLGTFIRESIGETGGVTPEGIEKFFVEYAKVANTLQDSSRGALQTSEGEPAQTSLGYGQPDPLKLVFQEETAATKKVTAWFKTLESVFTLFNIGLVLMPGSAGSNERPFLNSVAAPAVAREGLLGLNNLIAILRIDRVKPEEILEVISKLLAKFISSYTELTAINDFTIFRETDLSLLKAIDEDIKDQHGRSFFDPTKPLIIFGDLKNIATNLYGKSFGNTQNLITPKKLLNVVADKLAVVFNLYNSQNVTNTTVSELLEESLIGNTAKLNIETLIKGRNLPVFKYNTINPNIVSITVNDNKAYFSLLNQGYNLLSTYASLKTEIFKDPSNFFNKSYLPTVSDQVSTQAYKSLPDKAKQELAIQLSKAISDSYLATFYKEAYQDYLTLQLATDITITQKIKDSSFNRYVDTLVAREALITYLNKNIGLIANIENAYALDPVKFFVDQMGYLDQITYQVEIETLPYFPISTPLYMFNPCLLLAQRPRLVGDPKLSNPLDSISGGYNILGFYHRIDSSRAYSRFKLFSIPKPLEELKLEEEANYKRFPTLDTSGIVRSKLP